MMIEEKVISLFITLQFSSVVVSNWKMEVGVLSVPVSHFLRLSEEMLAFYLDGFIQFMCVA